MATSAELEQELEELRAWKAAHEHKAIDRAFARLEALMESASFDPLISIRAFKVIGDCLLTLKDEVRLRR